MSSLEDELNKTLVSFTDKIFVHPKEYPEYCRWYFPKRNQRTLYVACKDRPYTKIMENVYEGLTGEVKPFFEIDQKDRSKLYGLYKKNKKFIDNVQYWKPWWMREDGY